MWAPWYPLPTDDAHLRAVKISSFMGNIDIGGMFLTLILHQRIQQHARVDFTTFFPEELTNDPHSIWEHWEWCSMGFRFSPFQLVQGMFFTEEVICRDPGDTTNVFAWDNIVLSLIGDPCYDPGKSWVFKIPSDGCLACDFLIYINDY